MYPGIRYFLEETTDYCRIYTSTGTGRCHDEGKRYRFIFMWKIILRFMVGDLQMKIAITGLDPLNHGDAAAMTVIIKELNKLSPDAKLTILSLVPEVDRKKYGKYGVEVIRAPWATLKLGLKNLPGKILSAGIPSFFTRQVESALFACHQISSVAFRGIAGLIRPSDKILQRFSGAVEGDSE